MKILAVADDESPRYYEYYREGSLKEFDLILACGDLPRRYLEFLVTMARCPLLYVRGNHDNALVQDPPEGCTCIEDTLYIYKGIRILGLGGSFRYREDGHCMFTEEEMRGRIRRQRFSLWRQGGVDIVLTHAPVRHIDDLDTLAHRGFECFTPFMEKYHPRYWVHGHVHRNYGRDLPRSTVCGDTMVINAYHDFVFEMPDK